MTVKKQLQITLRIIPKTQMYDVCKMQAGLLNIKAGITNHNHSNRHTKDISCLSYHCSTLHSPKQKGAGTMFRTCRQWFSPASGFSWSSFWCRICTVVTGCTSHCRIPHWTPPRSSIKTKMCAIIVGFC